jgi:hypothetical protein
VLKVKRKICHEKEKNMKYEKLKSKHIRNHIGIDIPAEADRFG